MAARVARRAAASSGRRSADLPPPLLAASSLGLGARAMGSKRTEIVTYGLSVQAALPDQRTDRPIAGEGNAASPLLPAPHIDRKQRLVQVHAQPQPAVERWWTLAGARRRLACLFLADVRRSRGGLLPAWYVAAASGSVYEVFLLLPLCAVRREAGEFVRPQCWQESWQKQGCHPALTSTVMPESPRLVRLRAWSYPTQELA
jgi:hypothetical protein